MHLSTNSSTGISRSTKLRGNWLAGLFAVLLLSLGAPNSHAQAPIPDRNITVNLNGVTVEAALTRIADAGNFRFSYNPDLIPVDSVVSISVQNKPVKHIIEQLFDGRVGYKVTGRHLILRPAPVKKESKSEKLEFVVSGVVRHARTNQPLPNTSVYDVSRKHSALTNEAGEYRILISSDQQYFGLGFSKSSYIDSVIVLKPGDRQLDMVLLPVPEHIDKIPMREVAEEDLLPREVEELAIVKFVVPERQRKLNLNFDSILQNFPAQISLVPSIGTNRLVSGAMVNNLSINIIAGYSYAVKGVELGGFLNVTRTDMEGFQASGFANVVGGKVRGVQAAGFHNNCRGTVEGLQLSGFSNIVLDTIVGMQAAGFMNILHGHMEGGQVAGFLNVATKDVDGVQVAGFSNVALGDVNLGQISGFMNYGKNIGGAQIAGFMNLANGNVSGAQVAGYINVAENVNAAQIAGFANIATGDVKGAQVAGFINVAQKVGGGQIGFLNFADSVGGLTFGFFSWVNKGYHEIEIGYNDVFDGNLSFKTGTHHLYNIFSVSAHPFYQQASAQDLAYNKLVWAPGYGIGTELRFGTERFRTNIDFTGHQIFDRSQTVTGLNLLNKATVAFGGRIGKPFVFHAGPTFNVHLINQRDAETGEFSHYSYIDPLWENTASDLRVRMWAGLHAGVRF